MHGKEESEVLALAIAVLRSLHRFSQGDLAAKAGTTASVVSEYESGKRRPTRKVVDRFASALEVRPERLDDLLPVLRSLIAGGQGPSAVLPPEALAEEAARRAGLCIRTLTEAVLPAEPRRDSIPAPEDREKAKGLWARLRRLGWSQRRLLVDEGREFQSWALCELLCEESLREAEGGGKDAEELAELALRVARKAAGTEMWRCRLQGYAWAHVGHARRVKGDLDGAREAFFRCRPLASLGADAHPGLLDEERVPRLEALLAGN